MITEIGTSVGKKSSATDRLITDDVAVYLYNNKNYARQALPMGFHTSTLVARGAYTLRL